MKVAAARQHSDVVARTENCADQSADCIFFCVREGAVIIAEGCPRLQTGTSIESRFAAAPPDPDLNAKIFLQ